MFPDGRLIPRPRRGTANCLLGIVTLLSTILWTPPDAVARGEEPNATAGEQLGAPGIELVSQTDWVTNGAPFDFEVAVDGNPEIGETELVTTVYQALPNRSQFQMTLEGNGLGSSVILERRPLDEALGPDNLIRSSLPVQDTSQRRYLLRNSGVYPVKVELRTLGSSEPLDSFTTYLVNIVATPGVDTRLLVAGFLPLQSPKVASDVEPLSVAGTEPVNAVATALTRNPNTRISLVPSPESVERLAETEDGVTALGTIRDARNARPVGTTPVMTSTYTPIAAPMFEPDLSGERDEQFARGTDVVAGQFVDADSRTAFVTSRIDPIGAAAYRQKGATRFVVSETALAPAQRETTLARPISLSTGRGTTPLPAIQLDLGLEAHFDSDENPVLSVHRLLADLAVIYNDRPGQARGVAFTAPPNWTGEAAFVDVLMDALGNSPILASATVDELFELPPEGGGRVGMTRTFSTTPRDEIRQFDDDRILELRRRINGFASMVARDDPTLDSLHRQLLTNESALLDDDRRSTSLDATANAFGAVIDSIRLPDERSVRFTAREGEVPVSIQNDSGTTVDVVVRLSSDKVDFLDGDTRALEIQRQQVTERFNIDARTSGVFPVQMRLESPDGSLVLSRSQVIIRSTAASGVGVALSVGAGSFLTIWWLRSILRTRGQRKS